jgi:protein-disulfide isomerase
MSEADPEAPPATPSAPSGSPPPPSVAPPAAPSTPPRSAAWLGIVAVALGALVMVGGVVSIYLYVKALPPRPSLSAALPPPLPPEVLPPAPSPAPTTPGSGSVPSSPPVALAPFKEDAAALVPVERGRPLWGPQNSPVTLTLFGDFECPYTIAMLRVILAEKARRGDDLRLAFRFATLSQHAEGERAARVLSALHTVQGEGAFWNVVQEIARRGEPLSEGSLDSVLETLGIATEGPGPGVDETLEDDAVLASSLYVRATPVSFVNGVRVDGFRTQRALAEIIARERKASGLVLASGVTPQSLYAERTKKNLIDVGKDPPERSCVPVGGSPVRGAQNALVTIVEFTEHACEYCREGETLVSRMLASRPNDIRSVWKSLPLPQHPRARYAANFAFEARRAGGDAAFFTVSSALFRAKDDLSDEAVFAEAAEAAKLDLVALRAAAEKSAHDTTVDADGRLAETLGVSAAPTYFVNGRRLPGVVALPEFQTLVTEELSLARRVRKNGAGDVAELACGAHAVKVH